MLKTRRHGDAIGVTGLEMSDGVRGGKLAGPRSREYKVLLQNGVESNPKVNRWTR